MDPTPDATPEPPSPSPRRGVAQAAAVGLILCLTAFVIGYRWLVSHQLEQTAALFIGLPSFLAVLVVLSPRAETATQMILKGTTLALLLSGVVLQEGVVCILMAAPLFYAVGLVVGLLVDRSRKRRSMMLLLPMFAMSVEGVTPEVSFPRAERVEVAAVIDAPAHEVEAALAARPAYTRPLPWFLRIGFPRPTHTEGEGLRPGATRRIHFAGGEGTPGDLVLRVTERGEGYVRFTVEKNDSHIAHWLTWEFDEVRWQAIAPDRTRVVWSTSWQRDLDPAWYFRPLQRYAMRLAARTNLENVATPRGP